MRLRKRSLLGRCLLVLPSISLCSARSPSVINLPQFQPISGFSATCTQAYETFIPGCTAADFTPNSPCSPACINGLQVVSALINAACHGTSADSNTLIQLFLEGKGTVTLCPNSAYSVTSTVDGGSGSTSGTDSGGQISTSTPVTTLESMSTSADSTSPATDMSSTTGTIASSTETSASTAAVVSNPKTTSSPSSSLNSPTTKSPATSFTSTGAATGVTSKADQTTSQSPGAFGGGGSPFEISSGLRLVPRGRLTFSSVLVLFLAVLRI